MSRQKSKCGDDVSTGGHDRVLVVAANTVRDWMSCLSTENSADTAPERHSAKDDCRAAAAKPGERGEQQSTLASARMRGQLCLTGQ